MRDFFLAQLGRKTTGKVAGKLFLNLLITMN